MIHAVYRCLRDLVGQTLQKTKLLGVSFRMIMITSTIHLKDFTVNER